MKYLWLRWKRLAKKLSNFQTNLVITLIFLLTIVPISFIIKIFFRNYFSKISFTYKKGNYWQKRPKFKQNLDWARKQG